MGLIKNPYEGMTKKEYYEKLVRSTERTATTTTDLIYVFVIGAAIMFVWSLVMLALPGLSVWWLGAPVLTVMVIYFVRSLAAVVNGIMMILARKTLI